LKVLLSQKLRRKEWGKIWIDRQLRGNEPVPPELQHTVCSSAALLVILSEGYLQSDWCRRERELFLGAAAQGRDVAGRIFVVQRTDIERGRWPEAFCNLRGYQFFKKDREDGPARTLGVPVVDPNDRLYFERLDDLGRELQEQLKCIRSVQPPPTPGADITVFLAEVTADLEELRDNLRRHLEQAGLRVLPKTFYTRSPAAFQAAMEKDLAESVLFVQLLDRYVSPKTDDLLKGYEGLQLDLAKAAHKPILRWHSPYLDERSIKDRELLTSEPVTVMDFEDFKREVDKQARLQAVQRDRPVVKSGAFVLVDASSVDLPLADTVLTTLDSYGIGYDTIDEKASLIDLARDGDYDGLVIIYGQCEQGWVQGQVRLCRQIMLRKKERPPVCAVYIGPPESKAPLRTKPSHFLFFNELREAVFDRFIQAVQARVAT
jgi:hypothetical protein